MSWKDEMIIDILKKAKRKRKAISVETIAFNTDIHRPKIYDRLKNLEKRGVIKLRTVKKVKFFELVE